jgi:RNA recognition motif-containing protein
LPQRETKPPRKQEVKPLDKKPTIVPSISATRTTPDSHQVFVGNLPNGTTEEDLKGVFNKFGTVIEVRINPKNFGFVVFDSEKPVQVIIQSRNNSTLMLHDRKLNIEEKRPSTQRGNYGSGSGGNFGGFNNSRKIQQSSAFSGRPVRVPSGSSSKPQKR